MKGEHRREVSVFACALTITAAVVARMGHPLTAMILGVIALVILGTYYAHLKR